MDCEDLIGSLQETLISLDESLAANDVNSAIRKTHECMVKIKTYKDFNATAI